MSNQQSMTDVSNERLRYEDYDGHTHDPASLRMADHDKDYRDNYFDEATGRGLINGLSRIRNQILHRLSRKRTLATDRVLPDAHTITTGDASCCLD